MKYGYARVSSKGQNLTSQLKQLKEYGVDKIFKEKVSGRSKDREQFQTLLDTVQSGDTIVVSKLDRFARSTKDALNIIDKLNQKGVFLVVLNMGGQTVDTSTAIGKLMVTILAGIAEFEADMIKERQLEGIALAKANGVYKGKPKKYGIHNKQVAHALSLYDNRKENKMSVNDICQATKLSRATFYRVLKEQNSSNPNTGKV